MIRSCKILVCGLAVWLSAASAALSQYNYLNNSSGYGTGLTPNQVALKNAQQVMQNSLAQPSNSMSGAGRIGLGIGESYSGSKPFSNFSLGPAVSPYLNLFRVDVGNSNIDNYSTLVAPQLRQQQFNQQQQRQNQQTSRRLQSIAAEAAFNPQGSKEIAPTGHQTVFNYTGSYYPAGRSHAKKRSLYQ